MLACGPTLTTACVGSTFDKLSHKHRAKTFGKYTYETNTARSWGHIGEALLKSEMTQLDQAS